MSKGERIFAVLMCVYPTQFRNRYGQELLEYFKRDVDETSSNSNRGSWAAFWLRTAFDLFRAAVRMRFKSRFGGKSEREESRNQRTGETPPGRRPLLENVARDVLFALRTFRRQPALSAVVIGVIGLGIGASTTLFSAVDGVMLRPLPYPEPERLVFLGSKFPTRPTISGMSLPSLMDVMDRVGSVGEVAASRGRALDIVGDGEPERVSVALVSPDYFRVLGVTPALGSGFSSNDHQVEAPRVVMISDQIWQRRWGADPNVVGSTFTASDGSTPELQTYTVVGVLPGEFRHPSSLENPYSRLPASELWAPLPVNSAAYTTPRTNYTIRAIARLGDGASLDVMNQELDALAVALKEAYPEAHVRGDSYLGLGARRLIDQVVGNRRVDLLILLGATGLLLLIACTNVAGLLLARALDRYQEMGVRAALGASRHRLFSQLVIESLLLGVLGGAVGLGLAWLGISAFKAFGPADFPRMADVALNGRVLGFCCSIAMVTGLAFGVGPAFAASWKPGGTLVGSAFRGHTSGRRATRLRGALVTFEVAVALVLLSGSGLLIRSIVLLQSRETGVQTENLALMQVRLLPTYDSGEERAAFFRTLKLNLEGVPGVISVSYIGDPPMGFNNWAPEVWREEDTGGGPAGMGMAHPVGTDYFRTMGIPIKRGRTFTPADDANSPAVIVMSETMAEGLWPGEDPLGKRLGLSLDHGGSWHTVIGVSGDIRQNSLASDPRWDFYLPFAQSAYSSGLFMAVRTSGDPLELTRTFRQAVWALDANVPVPEITTMEARRAATLRLPRFRMLLLSAFAAVALLLAGAGIFGTVTYSVGRRTREIGIRMALGAKSGDVILLVLRQGIWPCLLGVGAGLAVSLAATKLLESILFQVSPRDPATFTIVAFVLVAVCVLACFAPTRRACRIDPQEALRVE